ncbi:hypothetical protein PR202_ga07873 [Eleusine coracana subsp. coracana]|uniref:Protein kinase domain-containing protein n=1 Tax=Eleusine coracana subsp. coracana TaxID=191504 RepID=A0AAV5C155_ELECO|nr:hypothetical protein PR202_ga07873 [Eleusine coracana subsp. coracana]
MEERYEALKELGAGNFGVARLVRDKRTKELVAVKYIERGKKIDENVQREIINHRSLRHPNIVRFKESALLHSKPKSTVGTPAYIAPEVLSRKEYDGKRILGVQYSIPDYVRVSSDCRRLLSQIFVADPSKRITIPEIKQHPWFLKNLPREISEREKASFKDKETVETTQPVDEIMRIVQEAKTPGDMSNVDPALLAEMAELESEEEDAEAGDDTY